MRCVDGKGCGAVLMGVEDASEDSADEHSDDHSQRKGDRRFLVWKPNMFSRVTAGVFMFWIGGGYGIRVQRVGVMLEFGRGFFAAL